MQEFMDESIEISLPAARTIAAAMREIAEVDGIHPNEARLLDTFEADLPQDGSPCTVALDTINNRDLHEAFFKSLLLVAYADGMLTELEEERIAHYAQLLSVASDDLTTWKSDVASSLLSVFSGVQIFRDSVFEMGRDLGLSEQDINAILT